LPDYVDDDAAARAESRWWRRLGSSFVSADSYGLVLLLVVATYVISVSMTETRAASIVLTVQLATVWLTLRTSQARRLVRLVADGVLFQPRPSRSATEATDVNGAGSAALTAASSRLRWLAMAACRSAGSVDSSSSSSP